MIPSLIMVAAFAAPSWNLKCKVSREYITTYNYLKEHKEFALTNSQVEQVAQEVAGGCDGAAKRFISVVNTLVKAQLDTASSIKLGRELSQRDESTTAAFLTIFKASYAADVLDLDLMHSVNNARALSLEIKSSPSWLEKDFLALTRYCLKKLDIPRPRCAKFVVNLAKIGSEVIDINGDPVSDGVYKAFVFGYEYLTEDKKGPKISSREAIPVLESLLTVSPFAVYEFKKLYVFGIERDINPLTRERAIQFAAQLSKSVRSKSYAH